MAMADLEEFLERNGWGEVKLKERKVLLLAYANDVILMAKDKEGMRGMIRRLKKYLKEKELELNVGKSKVMRFRKREWKEEKDRIVVEREENRRRQGVQVFGSNIRLLEEWEKRDARKRKDEKGGGGDESEMG